MQTSQPENNIKLPEDVQKAVDAARDNVTVLQAEAARLGRIKQGLDRNIVTAQGALKDTETKIEVATEKLETVKKETATAQAALNEANQDLSTAQKQMEADTKAMKEKSEELAKTKEEIDNKFKELDAKDKDLKKREKDLSEREDAHEAKVRKLEEALN